MQDFHLVHLSHKNKAGAISTACFGLKQAKKVRSFHQSFDEYSITPLVQLNALAAELGVQGIYVKDESYRFGLNAFKVLGGSYAIAREIGSRLGLAEEELSLPRLLQQDVQER